MKKSAYFLLIILASLIAACGRTETSKVEIEKSQTTETSDEAESVQSTENCAGISMLILDEINQEVQTGTTGAYMTAVREAVKMLDWGVGTGLDPLEIKEATIAWLMKKGNDEQAVFSEKLKQVDDAYHKLLSDDAMDLLKSAGCENSSYPWSNTPVEAIEAVMDAAGLRPYGGRSVETEAWKTAFEKSLMENYEVAVDHYEDLGDGVYQVYVVIDGKTVPYVTVDSKTGDYHG